MINALITIFVFFFMEGVAWFTHKYIMHGFLWYLHKDHHTGSEGFFEKNDAFFLIFAVPGFLGTFLGAINGFNYWFGIGLGITFYGIGYFLVHDVLIHRRFKWMDWFRNSYTEKIIRAHKLHHKRLGKEDGAYFGMLWIPSRLYKETNFTKKQSA
jgi:beta-carotene 3-hydroxylase